MQPKNMLYIISDEHARSAMGCYGHPQVKTPNLDRLAAQGTRFTNAYTPSPTCVPARASLATGQWVHQIGTWCSAQPYEGQAQSWMGRLRADGHQVASIGKLHFRDSHKRNGFSEEILPLHIVNGRGWVKGLMRDPLPSYEREAQEFAEQVGPGESSYTMYDRHVTTAACEWLQQRAAQPEEKPWVLFLSLVCPHYPLLAPQEFFDMYDPGTVDLPFAAEPSEWPQNPAMQAFYQFYNYDPFFDEERIRLARASYYALCTFLDHNIGQVLQTLEAEGLTDDTRIIYTSDHGEMLGNHGQWTKMCMYEDSAAIPFIMSGPNIPQSKVVDTAISLVDSYQTIVECVGETLTEIEQNLAGDSLFDIIAGENKGRVGFSEYHDGATNHGFFMLRLDDWKYIYFVNHPPQLFNLKDDPLELNDLGIHPGYANVRAHCEAELRKIVDPEAADAQAQASQAARLEELGGMEAVLSLPNADFGFTPMKDVGLDMGDLL